MLNFTGISNKIYSPTNKTFFDFALNKRKMKKNNKINLYKIQKKNQNENIENKKITLFQNSFAPDYQCKGKKN